MRHIGEIMEELGFKKDAPEDTQKAFLKHVMKAASEAENHIVEKQNSLKGEQLSFSLDLIEAVSTPSVTKKQVG